MTQEVFTGQVELTVRGINPTLVKGGEIFMLDAGRNTEGPSAPLAPKPKAPSAAPTPSPAPQDIRGEWMSVFSPRELQNIDTRRTIDAAVELGFGPAKVTSKGKTEQTAKSVVENATLDSQDPVVLGRSRELSNKEKLTEEESTELFTANADRISKAESLLKESLGRELTDAEKKAILKAHFVGFGEKGKDEINESGVFNVSQEQLLEKAKILKEAGFNKEQRREIIESGLAAAAPPVPLQPIHARNDAIAELQALPLTADLDGIRNRLLILHNQAINGDIAAGLEPNSKGISSEAFDAIYKGFYEKYKDVLNLPNTPVEVLALEQRFKQIKDLDDRTHQQRTTQDDFTVRYDFLNNSRDALLNPPPGTVPNPAQIAVLEEELVRTVEDYVGGVNPSSDNIYDTTLKRIIQTDTLIPNNPILQARVQAAVERLVIRIVGLPLQTDTGDFDIGFYGGINLAAIKNLLYSQSLDAKNFRNQAEYAAFRGIRRDQNKSADGLYQSMRIVHEINKMIVQNQLDAANQSAPNLGPEAMQMLSKTKGVGAIFRIMDSGLLELLAKDGYMAKGSYDALMGKAMSQKTGRYDNSQTTSIVGQVEEMVAMLSSLPPGLVLSQDIEELKGLQDWERDLAFNLGRNMYNVLHRSAELASWGRLPKGLKLYTNSVFGGFRNIYNPALHVIERFKPGEGNGGYRLFQMFMDAMQRRRGVEQYGRMGLKKIHGDDVKFFELPSIAGMRGYISSWKANEGVLNMVETEFNPTGRGPFADFDIYSQPQLRKEGSQIYDRTGGVVQGKGIGHFLDTGALTFKNSAGESFEWKNLSDEQQADYFRALFFEPGTGGHGHDPVLKRDINIGLGVIYKTALGPQRGHHGHAPHHVNEVKEQIRRLIWERAAEENPLAVLPYLHRLEFSSDHAPVEIGQGANRGTHDVRNVANITDNKGKMFEDIYDRQGWSDFQVKLMLLNEWRMSKIKQGDINYTLLDAIAEIDAAMNITRDPNTHAIIQGANPGISFTQQEYEWYDQIVFGAQLASRDMANVRFGFVPFANDMPLEQFNFEVLGDNSYQRHFGDIVQINSSTGAMIEAFNNLGTVKDYHGVVEVIGKFEKGITAVHGDDAAKDKAAPLVEAITRFFRRGENAGGEEFVEETNRSPVAKFKRYIRQWDEAHAILQQFHKANSIAQQFYNVEVLALDRHQIYMLQEELMANGLMGHEQEKEFRKNFGGFLGFIARMMLEGFLRTGKLSTLITARGLLGSSFKGAIE